MRPSPPDAVADLVLRYAGLDHATRVVDLGSGTGLSTRWCSRWADTVVGVEPSGDMREQAEQADPPPNVSFVAGWAHDTGQPDGSADVVVASQALHWMEPAPTYAEVARILRPGGVFVALDAEFPPNVGNWPVEAAWWRCHAILDYFEDGLVAGVAVDVLRRESPGPATPPRSETAGFRARPAGVKSWSKSEHLSRMRASGAFRFCTQLSAQSVEAGDGARLVDLLRSLGHLQQMLSVGLDEHVLGIDDLAAVAAEELGDDPRPFWWTYHVRLGVT